MGLKKILAGALAFVTAFVAVATPLADGLPKATGENALTASAETYTYGDYEYEILDDGTAGITKYNGYETELEIPEEIDGKKVTSIGENAFYDCTQLTDITIPDGVTSIGGAAFSAAYRLQVWSYPTV